MTIAGITTGMKCPKPTRRGSNALRVDKIAVAVWTDSSLATDRYRDRLLAQYAVRPCRVNELDEISTQPARISAEGVPLSLACVPEPEPKKWRLDFSDWRSLRHDQQALLLIVIGDCDGEWWGEGRAEFYTCEDALKTAGYAARLHVAPPRLVPAL